MGILHDLVSTQYQLIIREEEPLEVDEETETQEVILLAVLEWGEMY